MFNLDAIKIYSFFKFLRLVNKYFVKSLRRIKLQDIISYNDRAFFHLYKLNIVLGQTCSQNQLIKYRYRPSTAEKVINCAIECHHVSKGILWGTFERYFLITQSLILTLTHHISTTAIFHEHLRESITIGVLSALPWLSFVSDLILPACLALTLKDSFIELTISERLSHFVIWWLRLLLSNWLWLQSLEESILT